MLASLNNLGSGSVDKKTRDLAAQIQQLPGYVRHTAALRGAAKRMRADMEAAIRGGQRVPTDTLEKVAELERQANAQNARLIVIRNRMFVVASRARDEGKLSQAEFDELRPWMDNGAQGSGFAESDEDPAALVDAMRAAQSQGLGIAPLVVAIIAGSTAVVLAVFSYRLAVALPQAITAFLEGMSNAMVAFIAARSSARILESREEAVQQGRVSPDAPAPSLPAPWPGQTDNSTKGDGEGSSGAFWLIGGLAIACAIGGAVWWANKKGGSS